MDAARDATTFDALWEDEVYLDSSTRSTLETSSWCCCSSGYIADEGLGLPVHDVEQVELEAVPLDERLRPCGRAP